MSHEKLKNNESGWFTVASLPFVFILIIIAVGAFKLSWNLHIASEIQGTMDVAGVSALRMGVDEVQFREEKLVVNETVTRNAFKDLIKESKLKELIAASDFTIKTEVVEGTGGLVKVGGGLDFESERQQYYLISIIYATIPQVDLFDKGSQSVYEYFDIFKGKKFSIVYQGADEDGKEEIVIRSVSRLVLR